MGALHAGHLKLVEEGRRGSDQVVVSIFVNPLQFGPKEDLARYPRPFERDCELCARAGVDVVFAPEVSGFYSPDHATYCDVEGLDKHLCGASRPGHFRGVCTVVLKLFNLVQPHQAWFGKKDIQQALILKKMVSDLSLDLGLVFDLNTFGQLLIDQFLQGDRVQKLHHALVQGRPEFLLDVSDIYSVSAVWLLMKYWQLLSLIRLPMK